MPEAEKITLTGSSTGIEAEAAEAAANTAAAARANSDKDSFGGPPPAPTTEIPVVPEKFRNTDGTMNQDALLKSYTELQAAYSGREAKAEDSPEAAETPAETSEESGDPKSIKDAQAKTAEDATEAAGLNMEDLQTRYAETGELTEDDYKAFEATGIQKAQVDGYIEGQKAIAQLRQMDQDTLGGEQYSDMLKWAGRDGNMSEEAIDNFDAALNGTQTQYTTAIAGLKAAYVAANGTGDAGVNLSGTAAASSAYGFESKAQQVAAMKDPRYQSDPAYRNEVSRKTAGMIQAGVR